MNQADRPDSLPEAPSLGERLPRLPCDREELVEVTPRRAAMKQAGAVVLLASVFWLHSRASFPEQGVEGPGTRGPREGYEPKAENGFYVIYAPEAYVGVR